MHIVIITNGQIKNINKLTKYIKESDFVICADGAARYLKEINLIPNLLVGDFDSIDNENMEWMISNGVNLTRFPREKDKTDTELAIDFAFEYNPTLITLIGAIGSRVDHSIGNMLLLKTILDRNIKGKIIDEDLEMYLINDSVEIAGEIGDVLSLLPLTNEVKGLTIKNVLYPLNKANMLLGSTWGISNEFIDETTVKIEIEEGLLIVVKIREL